MSKLMGTGTTQYLKRAVKVDPDRNPCPFVDCECGKLVSLPVIAGMPLTYQCECGIEYDERGWVIGRRP